MFKINYILDRGNEKYQKSYPSPENENHNIFIFRGSNGLGKSTVMQILAIGMFGLDSKELSSEITNKMKRLIAEDTREFSFQFEVRSLDGKTTINSSLKNKNLNDLRTSVNGTPYNKTAFGDHFELIFDIPDEITKKLNSSLVVIKRNLGDYITYTKTYLQDIRVQYENLDRYNERTGRLSYYEGRMKEQELELKNYGQRLKSVKENYKKLR